MAHRSFLRSICREKCGIFALDGSTAPTNEALGARKHVRLLPGEKLHKVTGREETAPALKCYLISLQLLSLNKCIFFPVYSWSVVSTESKLESRNFACCVRHGYSQHLKHCSVRGNVLKYLFNQKNDSTVPPRLLKPAGVPTSPSFALENPREGCARDSTAVPQCISICFIG